MPIFEYDCPVCGRFEVILLPSEKEVKVCPNCEKQGKKNKVTKAVSPAAFHLKGNGWYKTDYSSKSSSSGSKGGTDSKSKSSDTKTEEKSSKSETKPSGGSCGSGCSCH